MRFFFLILLMILANVGPPAWTNNDPVLPGPLAAGGVMDAFRLIADEIKMPQDDRGHFKIIAGFSRTHDDRHGQADPQTLQVSLDPGS